MINNDDTAYRNKRNELQTESFESARYEYKDEKNKKDCQNETDEEGQNFGEWYDIPCCEKEEHKEYNVYVPVKVKPYVHVHRPKAKCVGELEIENGHMFNNEEHDDFEFTLRQKLCVDIPVKYGVVVHYYNPYAEEE